MTEQEIKRTCLWFFAAGAAVGFMLFLGPYFAFTETKAEAYKSGFITGAARQAATIDQMALGCKLGSEK